MDLSKVQYFEKIENTIQSEFVQSHNHCILCHSTLELRHIQIEDGQAVKEEAHCPECDVRTRSKVYSLN